MKGRADPPFASYTLPWASMGCICLSLEVNASHQASLPFQHLPTRMGSSYICVWGWHFNAYLFSHLFIWKKNFSLLLSFWHEEKLVYSQEKEENVFHFQTRIFLTFRLDWFSLVVGSGCIGVGRNIRNWNFRKYLKSKRLHYSPRLRKQWILMASGHKWTAWSFCVGSSCRWSVGARAYFAINVKISSPGSV